MPGAADGAVRAAREIRSRRDQKRDEAKQDSATLQETALKLMSILAEKSPTISREFVNNTQGVENLEVLTQEFLALFPQAMQAGQGADSFRENPEAVLAAKEQGASPLDSLGLSEAELFVLEQRGSLLAEERGISRENTALSQEASRVGTEDVRSQTASRGRTAEREDARLQELLRSNTVSEDQTERQIDISARNANANVRRVGFEEQRLGLERRRLDLTAKQQEGAQILDALSRGAAESLSPSDAVGVQLKLSDTLNLPSGVTKGLIQGYQAQASTKAEITKLELSERQMRQYTVARSFALRDAVSDAGAKLLNGDALSDLSPTERVPIIEFINKALSDGNYDAAVPLVNAYLPAADRVNTAAIDRVVQQELGLRAKTDENLLNEFRDLQGSGTMPSFNSGTVDAFIRTAWQSGRYASEFKSLDEFRKAAADTYRSSSSLDDFEGRMRNLTGDRFGG